MASGSVQSSLSSCPSSITGESPRSDMRCTIRATPGASISRTRVIESDSRSTVTITRRVS